ncbi:hypothetical protein SAMN04488107_2346 [Geodermatophilus saharensis]|uniref:Uncharacterized protein n=1 Tax=Geodermatophilus saharensis TaxID=1137994 RepID=A0A239E4C8_9ACTN|nr:hypothetical protein [Geodermatophilus saharensis]SNS38843.1 hypothetical protein SAMN04488107_2346 [Geodermatophilus saharensis]
MVVVRRVGAAILAVAAVAVWFLMEPAEPKQPVAQVQEQVSDRSREISGALADYEANERFTQGAPQQAVVNGWVAKDLLTIIAEQQNEALTRPEVAPPVAPVVPNDERVPALVGLLVLGLALAVATSPRGAMTTAVAPDPREEGSTTIEDVDATVDAASLARAL